jgi:hypothetical protein
MTRSRIVETVRDGIDRDVGVREGLNRYPVVSPTPHPSHRPVEMCFTWDDFYKTVDKAKRNTDIIFIVGGSPGCGMSYAALRLNEAMRR